MELFDRAASLQIGTILIDGLRVAFRCKKDTSQQPNSAEISVYNLSKTTRQKLSQSTQAIILRAGYADNLSVIFRGDTESGGITHIRDGADWITKIQIGDGLESYRQDRTQKSFGKGSSAKDVLLGILGDMGVDASGAMDMVRSDGIGAALQYVGGTTVSGQSHAELGRLLDGLGYEHSVQDNTLQIFPKGGFRREAVISLTPATGLIGSPEPGKDKLLKFRSLLQPDIAPGKRVEIKSDAHQGVYFVSTVTHIGDTHDQDWYTDCEGVPL